MKAIILARVSTEEQKEANNSLPAQLYRLQEYCKNKGFEIEKEFSFDETAYKSKRNQFDEFLEYVLAKKEKVAVCFDKVDRLSRSVFDKRVETLYKLAVEDKLELHFVSDNQIIDANMNAGAKFMFGIKLGLAKYYSDAISDNVNRTFDEKVRRGEIIGKAPYGYKNVTNTDGTKGVVVVPNEARIVKDMFNWYANGSYSQLTIKMKVKEEYGETFHKSKVQRILSNPFYYGERERKGILHPHNYPTLIDKPIFDKVQEQKQELVTRKVGYSGLPFAYKGVLKCAHCGCAITAEKHKGKYVYYHCTNYFKKHTSNPALVREEDLTEQFANVFEGLKLPTNILEQLRDTLKQSHTSKVEIRQEEIAKLQKQDKKIDEAIEKAYEDKIDGSITDDFYYKIYNKKLKQRSDVRSRLKKLDTADEMYYLSSKYLLDICEKAPELFKSSKLQEKRDLIKLVISNCYLDGKKVRYEAKKPFDMVLTFAKNEQWGG